MKKIQIVFMLLLASCGGKIVEHENSYNCVMVNESSHTVVVKLNDAHNDFPSPLTLEKGKSFSWRRSGLSLTPFVLRDREIEVVFDGARRTVYDVGVVPRNPYWEQNYTVTKTGKETYECVYTFTDEDYDSAEDI